MEPSGAERTLASHLLRSSQVASGLDRKPLGESKRIFQPPGIQHAVHPCGKPQGAADLRRLRRITAAPCLFGNADVAESWARAWPSYRTMSSPSRFGKPSGNMWGRMNTKRKRKRKSRRRRLLGSLLGHSWGLLGASWGPLGGLLGASLGLLGAFGGFLGASLAVLGLSWPV